MTRAMSKDMSSSNIYLKTTFDEYNPEDYYKKNGFEYND